MGVQPLDIFLLLQCGDRLYTSESDVYRRQILTTKVDLRAVRVEEKLVLLKVLCIRRHKKTRKSLPTHFIKSYIDRLMGMGWIRLTNAPCD